MKANELMTRSGTTTTALQLAAKMGMPKGLHFFADDGSGGGGNDDGGNDDGAGGGNDDDGGNDDGAHDEPTVLKTQHDAVLKEMIEHRKSSKVLTARLAELESNTPSQEELNELRDYRVKMQEADDVQKKKEGQYETLLKDKESKHAAEIQALQADIASERKSRRSESVENVLAKYIPQNTSVAVDDVSPLLRSFFKFDDEGTMFIEVNGEEPMDGNGKAQSPAEFIAQYIESKPHLATHKPRGGSGGTGNRNGGRGGKKQWTQQDLQNMTQEEWRENEKEIMAQIEGK